MKRTSSLSGMDTIWTCKGCLTLVYIFSLLGGVYSRSSSRSKPMDYHQLPKFLPTEKNFTFRVGQVAILQCKIENLQKKQVIWRMASDPSPLTVGFMSFSEDPRYSVEHGEDGLSWNLIIRDVGFQDAGVYECQVSSTIRHLRHHVTLTVRDPLPPAPTTPPPNIVISGNKYVDEGDHIKLVCNASSDDYPPEEIDWFRKGNTLRTDRKKGVEIHKVVTLRTRTISSILIIQHARLDDAGVYVCRTSNRDVTSTHINVLNGDTSNVKRGTVKKDGTSPSKGAYTDGGNAGNDLHFCVTSLIVSLMMSLPVVVWCVIVDLT